jgi:hypothetical protein
MVANRVHDPSEPRHHHHHLTLYVDSIRWARESTTTRNDRVRAQRGRNFPITGNVNTTDTLSIDSGHATSDF